MNLSRCTCGGAATLYPDGSVRCGGQFLIAACGRSAATVEEWNATGSAAPPASDLSPPPT